MGGLLVRQHPFDGCPGHGLRSCHDWQDIRADIDRERHLGAAENDALNRMLDVVVAPEREGATMRHPVATPLGRRASGPGWPPSAGFRKQRNVGGQLCLRVAAVAGEIGHAFFAKHIVVDQEIAAEGAAVAQQDGVRGRRRRSTIFRAASQRDCGTGRREANGRRARSVPSGLRSINEAYSGKSERPDC